MKQRYHDAMAIVVKTGKPDLFITFTCNPNWKEIKENLYPVQQPHDRPDILARVFKIYLAEFLKEIIVKQLFGRVVGWVYTIEFQKRGLPHAHCLFTLAPASKFNVMDEEEEELIRRIDEAVCAELPSIRQQKEMFDLVTKHMVHSPCEGK